MRRMDLDGRCEWLLQELRARAMRLPLDGLPPMPDQAGGPLPEAARIGTRDAAATAVILNNHARAEAADRDREAARRLVRHVVASLPDDPNHPAFGIYPRRIGDPPEAIHDRNWEGFVGTPLLRILQHDPRRLADWPEADRLVLAKGVRLPALAAIRRDVRCGYTNVVAMTLYLLLGAGRLLEDAEIRRAGERKLEQFLRFHESTGSFEEYNSPTYAGVVLPALVSLADVEADGPLAAATGGLLDAFLGHLAGHYHAPTGQLAGPQSRAYADALSVHSALPSFLYVAGVPPYDRLPEMAGEGGEAPGIALDASYPAAVPGLRLSEALRAAFARDFAEPVQTREVVEWVGRDVSRPAPEGEAPRFHLITTYRSRAFTLGSHNEECVWSQRRNVLAHWLDGRGELTGLKLEADIACPRLAEGWRYDVWPLQMAVECVTVQDGPRVLGVLIRADVVPAKAGDVLKAPSAYMGIGDEGILRPRRPIAWLLGTHWRQPIEPEDRAIAVERMAFRFSPIGRGAWSREGQDLFVFASGSATASIRTGPGARLEDGRLVLASHAEFEWDSLGGPAVLVPFAVGVGCEPPAGLDATEAAGTIRVTAGDMALTRRRISDPQQIERRTWHGRVGAAEIEPPR